MNPVPDIADIIALPKDRRERSIQVVKGVKRAVDAKFMYLFEGLCMNAADALFEEQFGSEDSDVLAQQFNITRALRLHSAEQFDAFRSQQGPCWVNLLNKKEASGIDNLDDEFGQVLHGYAERIRNHYKILLEELRLRFCTLVDADVSKHPLQPINFYLCFWHASEQLDLTTEERRLLMTLFNRFVMDRFGQVLALANQALLERGIIPQPTL